MAADLDALRARYLADLAAASTPDSVEAVRVAALGKSGTVTALLKSLGGLAADERLRLAPAYQALREELAGAIEAKKAALEAAALEARLAAERMDMSLPVLPEPTGSIHPIARVMDELAEIFADLGFAVAEGPEIEDDWHNFTALNIPPEHPARAMHDTFYLAGAPEGRVLRTHTSPVQIRTMTGGTPPIRIIAPGRVYRSDSDATHTPMFHQVEGLVIDRDTHMGHLKWTLETFVQAFFGVDDVVLRLRPSFFPFTEPSVEVDVGCSWEGGRLAIGGSASWLEILGAGMVHPKVISNCGLDPTEWQGFAFGCGIDRLAMLKYGMTDLRAFFDADLRWLRHYGFRALDVPTLSGGVSA
ncbi:phenylalanine--tRNA ligase subunit alpha [Thermaurantiacus sp.]